jgi:WD40 repeat protein
VNRSDRIADLEIGIHRRDGQTYAVEMRLLSPKADEEVRPESGVMQLDFDALRAQAADDAYGERLGAALLSDNKVREAFSNARVVAASADVPLRVRLLIGPTASELHTLKWEAVRDKTTTLFTGESLLFSRYISSGDWRPLRPKSALRAFALISNPTDVALYGLAPVRVDEELAGITAALGTAVQTVPAGRRATMSALLAAMREGFDMLYLVAHGKLVNSEPKIHLENDDGRSNVVSGKELVAKLSDLRLRPRLVVLGSCQSAGIADQPAAEGYMAALGPRLAESGIPAVVAMQGMVSMDTETLFMASFFKELRRHGLADMAMSVARNEAQLAKRPDWWMPVLFLRSISGLVWEPDHPVDIPDFLKYFDELKGAVDYSSASFVGREWLTKGLCDELSKLQGGGGIVVLEAPMGWGKTAIALRWVRAAEHGDRSIPVQLDGWAFARQGVDNGRGTKTDHPTGNLDIVLQQLESLTRKRLAMRRPASGGAPSDSGSTSNFDDFLHDCEQFARDHSRPVLLLIDAVDEALGREDLAERLPSEWPNGVQLVITGRSQAVGAHRIKGSRGRPVLRLSITDSLTRADLASYVAIRADQIAQVHGVAVEQPLRDAILVSGKASFVVVAGLLRERDDLLADLTGWRDGSKALPSGPFEYWDQEIARAVRRIRATGILGKLGFQTTGDVEKMVIQLLGCLIIGERDWRPLRLGRWLRSACAALLSDELGRSTAEKLQSLQQVVEMGALSKVLECMADLFGCASIGDHSLLHFVHQGLRDCALTLAKDHAPSVHGLFGVLCEHALNPAEPSDDEKLRSYAYRHAPRHLANAAARDPSAWKRGAQMMLDVCAGGTGYLDQLFRDPLLRNDAWEVFTRNTSELLRTVPRSQRADRTQLGLPDQLRSLRHVLADQHQFITRSELPLVAALFNRQAGHWKEGTPWGNTLRECAAALDRPWFRDDDPSPASALGPLTQVLESGVVAMASTPDGRWLAVGLVSGETRIWSFDALVSGSVGAVATRHQGAVRCVALLSRHGSTDVWLASGGTDGAVCVSRHDAPGAVLSRGSIDGGGAVDVGIAMQQQSAVTCVALVDGGANSPWWLAAGTVEGGVHVVRGGRNGLLATPTAGEPLRPSSGGLALRHAGSVLDIAFLSDLAKGSWWLASAGVDGTTQFVHGSNVCPDERRDTDSRQTDSRGRVATRHLGWAYKVAFLGGEGESEWWLASVGGDGASRVVSHADIEQRAVLDVGVDATQSLGAVVTLHNGPAIDLAFIAAPAPARWRLASVGEDGSSRITTDEELRQETGGWTTTGSQPTGKVATRHEGPGAAVAMLSIPADARWFLASAGAQDGVVRVASSVDLELRTKPGVRPDRSRPVEVIAMRHAAGVTNVEMLADVKTGEYWIVSGAGKTISIVPLDEGVIVPAPIDEPRFGRVATRHLEPITSFALLVGRVQGYWHLASGSWDGTARVANSDDTAGGDSASPIGRVVTCHGDHQLSQVSSVALAARDTPGDWWLASGAQDGSVLVGSGPTDSAQVVGAGSGGLPIGQLVSRHAEHGAPIRSLDLLAGTDPDHCVVAWADAAGAVHVSRTDGANQHTVVAHHENDASSVAFMPNSLTPQCLVASASWDGTVFITDSELKGASEHASVGSRGQPVLRHNNGVMALASLPSKKPGDWSFACGDQGGSVRVVTGTWLPGAPQPHAVVIADLEMAEDNGAVEWISPVVPDAPNTWAFLLSSADAISLMTGTATESNRICVLPTPAGSIRRAYSDGKTVYVVTATGRTTFIKTFTLSGQAGS